MTSLNQLLELNDVPSESAVNRQDIQQMIRNEKNKLNKEKSKHEIMKKGSFLHYFLFFIVAAIIIYAIFFFFKFSFVQSKDLSGVPTGSLDQSRAILWSVVVGLIITVLVYLLMVPRNKW